MKIFKLLAATCLVTGCGALAAAPSADDKPQVEESAKKEKKICRSEKMTGSLTRVRRVCMTRAEWAEMAESTNRALERMGRTANQVQGMPQREILQGAGNPVP